MVTLAYVHPGTVHACFLDSVVNLQGSFRPYMLGIMSAQSGPLLSKARNLIVEGFLSTNSNYLLFADTDMHFLPGAVEALYEADKPIVGALYYGVNQEDGTTFPVALTKQDGVYKPLPGGDIPERGCKRVDAVGMGLTLIKREVLESLDVNPATLQPFSETIMEGRAVGEDVTFCLRAKQKGFHTWLCGDARVGHAKTFIIDG